MCQWVCLTGQLDRRGHGKRLDCLVAGEVTEALSELDLKEEAMSSDITCHRVSIELITGRMVTFNSVVNKGIPPGLGAPPPSCQGPLIHRGI
jgi:hypothetical protein